LEDVRQKLVELMRRNPNLRNHEAWPPISRAVRVPHTEADYQDLVELLDRITDEVGEDENHPLASLMDVLGVLIEKYEDEHVPELTE
jgi:HTH-type transcriptional regulator/antitoxin HigA